MIIWDTELSLYITRIISLITLAKGRMFKEETKFSILESGGSVLRLVWKNNIISAIYALKTKKYFCWGNLHVSERR